MADSFDRYDNEGQGNGFMMGLLTGAVLGAGIGMLLAPKAGSEMRGALGEQARNLGNMANDQYKKASETATGWAERGREYVDKAREAAQRGVEDARNYAANATGATHGSGPAGSGFGSPTGNTGTTYGSGPTGSTGSTGSDYGRS